MSLYGSPGGVIEFLPDQNVLPAQPSKRHHPKLVEVVETDSIVESTSRATGSDIQLGSTTQLLASPPALDWDGPDDPDNPYNWPTWRRVYITFSTALLGFAVYAGSLPPHACKPTEHFCSTFGSSVYSPAAGVLERAFAVTPTKALLPLGLYVLGLAFGPMLAAPISEIAGRLVVYRISIPLAMLFTLGAGFASHLNQLCVLRFFAGFFGSPILAVGAGSNTDVWPVKDRAIANSFFALAPFLGPALGYVVGSTCLILM